MEVHLHIILFFSVFLLSNPSILKVHSQLSAITDDLEAETQIQTYIVHVEKPDTASELLGEEALEIWHNSFLPNATLSSGEPRLVYSYTHAISGFAALLTPYEASSMASMKGFILAEPEEIYTPSTTYTHKFLNLSQGGYGAWASSSTGEGTIIGIIDSGILATHPSFSDDGMPSPPKKWKGKCFKKWKTKCNNKIIGAAVFGGRNKKSKKDKKKKPTPKDDTGHGTHIASVAAGNFVSEANVLGAANGTACGTAPKAHISVYKVCHANNCTGSDVLAGIDQAIKDGVDIINLSLGGKKDTKFYRDVIALGSLSAIKKGIVAVAAAGNFGPDPASLGHSAPWLLTVGATSTDRKITATVKLGNGVEITGETAYQPSSFNSSAALAVMFPGIYGSHSAKYCLNGSLDYVDVEGKAVLCWAGVTSNIKKGKVVAAAGGAAMIIMNEAGQGCTTAADAHVLPACHVNFMDGRKLRDYVFNCSSGSNSTATASISFNGTLFGSLQTLTLGLAAFSSRGPSLANGGILKPDILAPGVNILGAWPFEVGPFPAGFAGASFNFHSGTSTAAAHIAGIAALIKNKHPKWSPAAIMSAIVTSACDKDQKDTNSTTTTAGIVDENTNATAGGFAAGAGLVNATGALDPGLVFDDDSGYTNASYFCGLGYSDKEVKATCGEKVKCEKVKKTKAGELNYASIAWHATNGALRAGFRRTVRNVGESRCVYRANVTAPLGLRVMVVPKELRFERRLQKLSFSVALSIDASVVTGSASLSGKLMWVSKKKVVTSPIAVVYSPPWKEGEGRDGVAVV